MEADKFTYKLGLAKSSEKNKVNIFKNCELEMYELEDNACIEWSGNVAITRYDQIKLVRMRAGTDKPITTIATSDEIDWINSGKLFKMNASDLEGSVKFVAGHGAISEVFVKIPKRVLTREVPKKTPEPSP